MEQLSVWPDAINRAGSMERVFDMLSQQKLLQDEYGRPPMAPLVAPDEIRGMLKLAKAAPEGCFVEVGVYHGGSAYFLSKLAERQKRAIYLYDTFEGVPYHEAGVDVVPLGECRGSSLERVREQLGPYPLMFKGIFPKDVPLPLHPVAFAHLDVDQYQSYVECIAALKPLMVPGGVMWFDDVPTLPGATRAAIEAFPGMGFGFFQGTVASHWYVNFPSD